MKKSFISIIMLITVSLSFVGSVSGADVDLSAPAYYFPEGTIIYAAVRIDSETIATLDALLAKVVNQFAEAGMLQGGTMTLAQGLDMASMMLTQQSFSGGIRPWLGDWAAFGLINVDDLLTQDIMIGDPQIPAAAVLHITDRAQAAIFLDALLKKQFTPLNYTQQTVGQYTVFQSEFPDVPLLMLGADVLIITTPTGQPYFETAPERTLYDSAVFTETVAQLPEDYYHILGYFDLADYFKAMFSMFGSFSEEFNQALVESGKTAPPLSPASLEDYLPEGITLDDMLEMVGQQAVGLTLLENRVLLVDVVQKTGDIQRLEALGLVAASDTTPLNPAFLDYIPAGVDVLYHGTNAKYEYDSMMEQARNTEAWEQEFYKQYSGWFNFANLTNVEMLTSREQLDALISDIDAKLQPVTGLSLEADIISWLTGDHVFFAAYDVPEPGTPSFLTSTLYPGVPVAADVEFGLIIQATDPLKAQQVADTLAFAITPVTELSGLTIEPITIGDAKGTLVTIPPQDSLAAPLEIVLATNQDIFVLATRATATAILIGPNSIQTDPHFGGAQFYVLPNATKFDFIDEDGINLVADAYLGIYLPQLRLTFTNLAASLGDSPPTENSQETLLAEMAEDMASQQTTARMVSALISSGSFSETVLPDDDRISRLVLVFAE